MRIGLYIEKEARRIRLKLRSQAPTKEIQARTFILKNIEDGK